MNATFKERLNAHYARAGAEHASQLDELFTKDQAMHPIVEPAPKPLTEAGLREGFELAVKRGMPADEAARLSRNVAGPGFLNLVNDATRFVRRLTKTREDLASFGADLSTQKTRDQIKQVLPQRVTEGRSPEDIDAIIDAVRDYALAVIKHIDTTLEKALANSDTEADRAVGMARFADMSASFKAMRSKAVEVLDSFQP